MEAAEKYAACVGATRAFVRDAGFADVVIGLSGGMDSSLVAVMAVDALGACWRAPAAAPLRGWRPRTPRPAAA